MHKEWQPVITGTRYARQVIIRYEMPENISVTYYLG
jgi:hypothetical protein